MVEFRPFPKLPRLTRGCVITEKIDGTNASVCIGPGYADEPHVIARLLVDGTDLNIRAGSRTRWITPGDDNFGFAAWVRDNAEELVKLGVGHHFGEWWGHGIQRGYRLSERRFSLFNTGRWIVDELDRTSEKQRMVPDRCKVVPVIRSGTFCDSIVNETLWLLHEYGSLARPGFMKPEGIVIFHEASGMSFKKTLDNDDQPKGK